MPEDRYRNRITVLEANLDDLSPQVLAYAMERLLAEGALDVFSVPVQMKKNRAGALLTVLAKLEDADRLTKLMFAETTTLGVRRREEQRQILARRWESVETQWGRGANQDCEHEWHGFQLCSGVRGLQSAGGATSCAAQESHGRSAAQVCSGKPVTTCSLSYDKLIAGNFIAGS